MITYKDFESKITNIEASYEIAFDGYLEWLSQFLGEDLHDLNRSELNRGTLHIAYQAYKAGYDFCESL